MHYFMWIFSFFFFLEYKANEPKDILKKHKDPFFYYNLFVARPKTSFPPPGANV